MKKQMTSDSIKNNKNKNKNLTKWFSEIPVLNAREFFEKKLAKKN